MKQGKLTSYFEKLLHEENPRHATGEGVPNQGATSGISREQVVGTLKKMKTVKCWDMITSRLKCGNVQGRKAWICCGT